MEVIFRSGHATGEALGGDFECFTGGGKVTFYKPGSPQSTYEFDINNDGTLQTPLGAIKKVGN